MNVMDNRDLAEISDATVGGRLTGTRDARRKTLFTSVKPNETQTLRSLGQVPSYRGRLPSPFPVINYRAALDEPAGRRMINQREV